MAAGAHLLTDTTRNELSRKLLDPERNVVTENRVAVREPGLSFLMEPPRLTKPVDNSPTHLFSGVRYGSAPEHSTDVGAGHRTIAAVIRNIQRETVQIECEAPEGHIRLQLPPTLIPDELMHVGQPVEISLETTGGFRRPVLRARSVEAQPKLPGQEEFEKWADSL